MARPELCEFCVAGQSPDADHNGCGLCRLKQRVHDAARKELAREVKARCLLNNASSDMVEMSWFLEILDRAERGE